MNRIIALALALVFGVAQAMTITPHPSDTASSSSARAAPNTIAPMHTDMDDDEAAPPVHIHHAHTSSKKPIKKPSNKKIAPVYRPKPYSLLFAS